MGIQWFTDVLHGFLFFCSWFFGLPVWRFFSITTCIPRSTHHVIYNTSSHAILTVVHSSRLLQSALAVDEQRTTQISVDYLSSLLGRIVGRTLVIISASSIKHQLSSTTIIPILLTTLLSPLPPISTCRTNTSKLHIWTIGPVCLVFPHLSFALLPSGRRCKKHYSGTPSIC